jgi:ABC-2 type transport system ATP-binding protein
MAAGVAHHVRRNGRPVPCRYDGPEHAAERDEGDGVAILETHDIGKRYGRRNWALRHLDLAVPDGSVTALVGPNGSGKSTLLKAWVGFERPTEGRLLVQGIDPWKDRAAAIRQIGYVPQAPSLYRELTVDEHVQLAGTLRPGFDPAIARRRLDDLDIPLTSQAEHLSGGQQAQVGLALALGTRAPVLLLDEPLASLDPLARREFLHVLVDAVHASGATALLSSHVITDIEQACDRLLVLGGGRMLLDVSIAEAIAAHRVIAMDAPEAGNPIDPATIVGRFPSPSGERMALVRGDLPDGRAATLEEVVLGHLAAGRAPRRERVPAVAA